MSPAAPSLFSLESFAASPAADFPFFRAGKALSGVPVCGLTLFAAGSMRYKNGNPNRGRVFSAVGLDPEKIAPADLCHSKIVIAARTVADVQDRDADGVITVNRSLIPSVTVADCMPIYLYEPRSGCFGVLHSGWKGTGIVLEALSLAQSGYGARPEEFSVVLGPHIRQCCYDIPAERAAWFRENFTPDCVIANVDASGEVRFYLSLAEANLALLKKAGVPAGNIAVCRDCTCCSPFLGSFRRETAFLGEGAPLEKRFEHFTPMAAYVRAT